MKRAGDVIGTPDWQLDTYVETEHANAWEKLNRPSEMQPVSSKIGEALKMIHKAESLLAEAASMVEGSYFDTRITSLMNSLEDLDFEIDKLNDNVKKGA